MEIKFIRISFIRIMDWLHAVLASLTFRLPSR